jgi:hypothetical protein
MDGAIAPQINDMELVQIYHKSKTVKAIAIIDIVTSFFYLIFTPYTSIINLVGLIFCYFGYTGAKNFNNNYLCGYLLYNLIKFISSVVFPIILFANINFPIGVILFSVILMLLNVYILAFVYRFYNDLSRLTEDDKEYLRMRNYNPMFLVVW